MIFSFLVLISLVAVSFANPIYGTEENDLVKPDLSSAEVHQQMNQTGGFEEPKSLNDFEGILEKLSDTLHSCRVKDGIDLKCFNSAQTLIIQLSEEANNSNLSTAEKQTMKVSFLGLFDYFLPRMQRLAEEKCTQIQHFTSECIYFNFENFAEAVSAFERYTKETSKEVLNYDARVQGSKELFLVAFRTVMDQYRRLSEVSTTQWSEKADLKKVTESFGESAKIHNETIAILRSKGVNI